MSAALTAAAHIRKAERALSAARVLLRAGNTEGVCNRAYYAMFDAAQAALLATKIADVKMKTHSAVIASVGKHLVQSRLIDAKHGRSFNQVQRLRQLADYTGEPISTKDATWALAQAEAFVATIKSKFAMHGK